MAKYCGKIGFVTTSETTPGVWQEQITERTYYGDVVRFVKRWDKSNKVNEDIEITNEISIVSDMFATENLGTIRYIEWMNNKWKVVSVEVQFPRLILTLGGLYNENAVEPPDDSGSDSGDQESILSAP